MPRSNERHQESNYPVKASDQYGVQSTRYGGYTGRDGTHTPDIHVQNDWEDEMHLLTVCCQYPFVSSGRISCVVE